MIVEGDPASFTSPSSQWNAICITTSKKRLRVFRRVLATAEQTCPLNIQLIFVSSLLCYYVITVIWLSKAVFDASSPVMAHPPHASYYDFQGVKVITTASCKCVIAASIILSQIIFTHDLNFSLQ
jgi:hypothetical protein